MGLVGCCDWAVGWLGGVAGRWVVVGGAGGGLDPLIGGLGDQK